MKMKRWTDDQLCEAVKASKSLRQVLLKLGLVPAGGNYNIIGRRCTELKLDTVHFTGQGWNVGLKFKPKKPVPLTTILINGSSVQSYKLKRRLIAEGLKQPRCELCGWEQTAPDGRIPIELDHINGNSSDNRLSNLRILCPNCHSLQLTHRGKNKQRARVM